MGNPTIKTRIQLKNDTEANWNKAGPKDGSLGFIPLMGELIIYSADDAHPFSRLKVGDGVTNVVELPFIDAATISGKTINEIIPAKLQHSITFGANEAYTFDGSRDVTVPVYMGVTT